MKPYLLFAGMNYYASGGWADFQSDHDTLDDALVAGREWMAISGVAEDDAVNYLWWHVVDTTSAAPKVSDDHYPRDERGLVIS